MICGESVSAVCMCRSLEASFNEANEFFASYELQVYVVKFFIVMMMEKIKLSKIAMKQVSAMPGGSTVP